MWYVAIGVLLGLLLAACLPAKILSVVYEGITFVVGAFVWLYDQAKSVVSKLKW